MRIERVSDTQIRFILMSDDLKARDINLSELHQGSDKTQQLFREILERVQDECGFHATQMMLEAKWDGDGSVVVMVTKLADEGEEEPLFDLNPPARTYNRFKRAGLIEPPENAEEDSHSVFSFPDMELAAAAAAQLHHTFDGPSRLYKHDSRYFLWFKNETDDERTTPELEMLMHEFGQKHISGALSQHYLEEHGEVIIADGAVGKLKIYHGM